MDNCKLIAIAAVSIDGFIGIDNDIPWHIPEDFKHFRKTTMGHALIVGYTTFLTLPEKALEGREYFVLNGGIPFENKRANIFQFSDIEELLTFVDMHVEGYDEKEVIFVAGGSMVYDSLLEYCDEAIITWVDKIIENGNKSFPIERLFNTFAIIGDQGWVKSSSGESYKITHYKKG